MKKHERENGVPATVFSVSTSFHSSTDITSRGRRRKGREWQGERKRGKGDGEEQKR